ncbi:MAG: ketoacyl-ACP synthase III [Treponema sp.]|jgi:3-oxoacyl-[acyl-carrier-protein] synthase-3|nr:ketoacyl-ACP synthase III [Treponema sp.]
MKTYITALDYYLPQRVLTNEDLAQEFSEWEAEKIAGKVGIHRRHIAAQDETATDMAIQAALNLFAQGIDKAGVDYLLFCTQSPDYALPASACIIQDRLGLSKNTGALDFNQGCSGYIYGLSLAKGLIVAGIARQVLLLTAETYTKRLHAHDKGTRTIFGDAASATLIGTAGFAEIGDFCLGTDGSGAEHLIVKTGGARNPQKANTLTWDENHNPVSADHIYMNGGEIFAFTLQTVPPLVAGVLAKNKLSKDGIDLFVFHQANQYMLEFLQKALHISKEKFYLYLSEVGNTVSSTIPIALSEALKSGVYRPGMKTLLAGFGVGLSWGGVVVL